MVVSGIFWTSPVPARGKWPQIYFLKIQSHRQTWVELPSDPHQGTTWRLGEWDNLSPSRTWPGQTAAAAWTFLQAFRWQRFGSWEWAYLDGGSGGPSCAGRPSTSLATAPEALALKGLQNYKTHSRLQVSFENRVKTFWILDRHSSSEQGDRAHPRRHRTTSPWLDLELDWPIPPRQSAKT